MNEKNNLDMDLDPEVIKVRDKIIAKIGDKPLEEVNSIIKKLLDEQMDEVTRIGALAARLKIIRSKIDLVYERKVKISKPVVEEIKEENPSIEKKDEDKWIRVKMVETGDVNGKQIDKGVVLDVKEDDGNKLIEAKKAILEVENEKDEEEVKSSTENSSDASETLKKEEKTENAEKPEKVDNEKQPASENKSAVDKTESEKKSEQKSDSEDLKGSEETEKKNEDKQIKTEDKKEENIDKKEEVVADEGGEKKDLLEQHKEKVGEVDGAEPLKEPAEMIKDSQDISSSEKTEENSTTSDKIEDNEPNIAEEKNESK